jgi:hypothetical protein
MPDKLESVESKSVCLPPNRPGRLFVVQASNEPDNRMKENKERWIELCEQAANEQDPAKMLELVKEINRLLEIKTRRLANVPSSK